MAVGICERPCISGVHGVAYDNSTEASAKFFCAACYPMIMSRFPMLTKILRSDSFLCLGSGPDGQQVSGHFLR